MQYVSAIYCCHWLIIQHLCKYFKGNELLITRSDMINTNTYTVYCVQEIEQYFKLTFSVRFSLGVFPTHVAKNAFHFMLSSITRIVAEFSH